MVLVVFTIVIANCKTQNKSTKINKEKSTNTEILVQNTQVVIPYVLPDDSLTMTEAQKKEFISNFEKGIVIYNTICASCHNKLVNGVMVVPDFSLPQLMDYEMRIQYPSHEDRLKETNLSALELDNVVHYLRYKKLSGVHF